MCYIDHLLTHSLTMIWNSYSMTEQTHTKAVRR